jgi:DivIVA domain-containing protein
MPLTPEDVSNKRFTPVRLREGYDMGEVDQFLDEVEAELARLTKENDDLRAKLSAAQTGGGSSFQDNPPTAQTPAIQEHTPEPEPEPEPAPPPPPAPEPVVAAAEAAPQTIRVETVPEASNAAARLLEIATRNADELVDQAKDEADKIIGEARTKAERLDSESKVKADRLESDARTRAQMLDSETAERRQQMFGELERERDKLNSEVETLRAFEREYRSRLKSYFSQQLEALSGPGESPAVSDEQQPAPKRLRSILGDDEV